MTLLYNGVQYEVESEGDDMEAINIPEAACNGKATTASNNQEESYWRYKTVHAFLDECIKRKMLIRDPKIGTNKLFLAIHKELKAQGFYFKPITLIRKLNTLKSQFFLLRKQNKNRTDPTIHPVRWPYSEKMEILFPDEEVSNNATAANAETQKSPQIMTRNQSRKQGTRKRSLQKNAETNLESAVAQTIINDGSSSSLLPIAFPTQIKSRKSQQTTSNCNSYDIESFKKEMLHLETRRTIAAEQILLQLHKSNEIKKELLEVKIKIFEASKEMEDF